MTQARTSVLRQRTEGAVPRSPASGNGAGRPPCFFRPRRAPLYDLRVPVGLFSVTVILLALATHRVTRWVTRDKFPLYCVVRDKFVTRWGVYADAPAEERGRISMSGHDTNLVMRSLAYAWECDWCTSIWVGAGLTYLTWRWHETMLWVLAALVASSVTGLIAQREPD